MVIRRIGCEELVSLVPWGLEWKDDGIARFGSSVVASVVASVVVVDVDVVMLLFRFRFPSAVGRCFVRFVSRFDWKLGIGVLF